MLSHLPSRPLTRSSSIPGATLGIGLDSGIERAIASFMSARRPPTQVRSQVDLGFNIKGYSIEIFEIRPQWDNPKVIQHHPCAKATYLESRDLWKLYWMRADLKWHAYTPASEVKKIEEVLEIVGNDENCCFFG